MISGIDLNATVNYTLKDDVDNPTVWKIGVFPSYVFARISGESGSEPIQTVYKLLQISLKGWENFNIPFETEKEKFYGREMDVVPMRILERIPMKVVSELSIKAMEINQITESERKN